MMIDLNLWNCFVGDLMIKALRNLINRIYRSDICEIKRTGKKIKIGYSGFVFGFKKFIGVRKNENRKCKY